MRTCFALQWARYKVFRKLPVDNILVYCLEKILFSSLVFPPLQFIQTYVWFYIGFLLPVCMTTYIKEKIYNYLVSVSSIIHMSMLYGKLSALVREAADSRLI